MDRPTEPEIVVFGTRWEVAGQTNHGGHHLMHIQELGIPTVAVDTKPIDREQIDLVTHFHGTTQEFLKQRWGSPLKWAIISTPDWYHVWDLQSCIEAGVQCILVEKPIALNPGELQRFRELQEVASQQRQIIMSCLPRMTDMRYQQLLNMMPALRQRFGTIKSFMHWLNAQQNRLTQSAGSDHIAHEITTLMQILGVSCSFTEVDIKNIIDSPEMYELIVVIQGINCTIWTNKKSEKPGETICIEFEWALVQFNTTTKTITIDPHEGEKEILPMVDWNPKARLMAISENFVRTAHWEGVQLYLPDYLLNASADFPARLFPIQSTPAG